MTYFTLQEAMRAFKAVLADLSDAERVKKEFRFKRALTMANSQNFLDERQVSDGDAARTLDEIIRAYLAAGRRPGRNISWDDFTVDVQMDLGPRAFDRGNSPRSIRRAAKKLLREFGQNGQNSNAKVYPSKSNRGSSYHETDDGRKEACAGVAGDRNGRA